MKTKKINARGLALGALVLSPALISLAYADACDCSRCDVDCYSAAYDAEANCHARCAEKPPEEQEECDAGCSGVYATTLDNCEEDKHFCIFECEVECSMC